MNIARRFLLFVKPVVENFLPGAATGYRLVRDLYHAFRTPHQTALGFKFAGPRLMERGLFETAETPLIKRILARTDVFINIGANVGYYCCFALQRGIFTLAFEPHAIALRCLYKNVVANGWGSNIEIFPIALGNKIGVTELYGSGTGATLMRPWASTHLCRYVPVSTAERVLGNRLIGKRCLIVLDVEGAESQVLEGAKNLMQLSPKPVWMVEITSDPQRPVINAPQLSVFQKFKENGYDVWCLDDGPRLVENHELVVGAIFRTSNFFFVEHGAPPVENAGK